MSDEKRARDILAAWVTDNPDVPPTPPRAQVALVESLAQALADEREKARAPFLRSLEWLTGLADEHEQKAQRHFDTGVPDLGGLEAGRADGCREGVEWIRRAAEESGE